MDVWALLKFPKVADFRLSHWIRRKWSRWYIPKHLSGEWGYLTILGMGRRLCRRRSLCSVQPILWSRPVDQHTLPCSSLQRILWCLHYRSSGLEHYQATYIRALPYRAWREDSDTNNKTSWWGAYCGWGWHERLSLKPWRWVVRMCIRLNCWCLFRPSVLFAPRQPW